jgi:hypothetical protein
VVEAVLPVDKLEAQHVEQRSGGYRYVKLVIHKPATQWGSSVWRFQIWG